MTILKSLSYVLIFVMAGTAQYGYVDGVSASQIGYKNNDQKRAFGTARGLVRTIVLEIS